MMEETKCVCVTDDYTGRKHCRHSSWKNPSPEFHMKVNKTVYITKLKVNMTAFSCTSVAL